MPSLPDSRRLRRRLVELLLLSGIAVALVALLPGAGDVGDRLGSARPGWLAVAAALELGSAISYVVVFRAVFCPRLGRRRSAAIGLAEQAANSLFPAGGVGGFALGAWALRRLGMPLRLIARRSVAFFLVTSLANVVALALAAALLALGIGGAGVPLALALVPVGLAAGATAVVLCLPPLTDRLGTRAGEGTRLRHAAVRAARTAGEGVRDTVALVRSRDAGALAGSLGYLLFDIAVLWASFRAFGAAPAAGVLVVAYLLGQLGALIPLPGGIGGVEGGLIGALVLYGTPATQAAAAVLTYRMVMIWMPIVLGAPAFVVLRRTLPATDHEVPATDQAPCLGAGPEPIDLDAFRARERAPRPEPAAQSRRARTAVP